MYAVMRGRHMPTFSTFSAKSIFLKNLIKIDVIVDNILGIVDVLR